MKNVCGAQSTFFEMSEWRCDLFRVAPFCFTHKCFGQRQVDITHEIDGIASGVGATRCFDIVPLNSVTPLKYPPSKIPTHTTCMPRRLRLVFLFTCIFIVHLLRLILLCLSLLCVPKAACADSQNIHFQPFTFFHHPRSRFRNSHQSTLFIFSQQSKWFVPAAVAALPATRLLATAPLPRPLPSSPR